MPRPPVVTHNPGPEGARLTPPRPPLLVVTGETCRSGCCSDPHPLPRPAPAPPPAPIRTVHLPRPDPHHGWSAPASPHLAAALAAHPSPTPAATPFPPFSAVTCDSRGTAPARAPVSRLLPSRLRAHPAGTATLATCQHRHRRPRPAQRLRSVGPASHVISRTRPKSSKITMSCSFDEAF